MQLRAYAYALAYNDFKDVLWANHYISRCRKPDEKVTGYSGQYMGMRTHITRLFHALVCELTLLLKEEAHQLEQPLFQKTYKQLPRKSKEGWNALIDFANGKVNEQSKEFHKLTLLIRNNITFHYYQPKFLAGGYNHFFSDKRRPGHENAFISRGVDLLSTRFYFADAAVDGCFDQLVGEEKIAQIRLSLNAIANAMNKPIFDVVTTFIQTRGYKWHSYLGYGDDGW